MILKQDIARAIEAQKGLLTRQEGIIGRELIKDFKPTGNYIEVISGIRRCGKSTLMKEIIKRQYSNFAYFNFEDSRVYGFEVGDFDRLDELFGTGVEAYFFDEIQNVAGWEVFVRQLNERKSKVYITGSNAAMLSKELGTRLTGRYLRYELFPFSYKEFLTFHKLENNADSFSRFLNSGGFPEYQGTRNPEILQNLLRDIVLRDIAVRYGIRNTDSLMNIALYMISNIGKEFSFNNLRKLFSVGSANSISDYLSWLGDTYLLYYLPRFSWSAKSTAINPRKVYAVDSGLVCANSLIISENRGRLLENIVFMHLRRQNQPLYYFRENRECDFVVFRDKNCSMVIQVCETLSNDNLNRETEGLEEAMRFFGLKEGYIITREQKDLFRRNQLMIHVLPANEFLINSVTDYL